MEAVASAPGELIARTRRVRESALQQCYDVTEASNCIRCCRHLWRISKAPAPETQKDGPRADAAILW